jgi:hypothetical protein
MQVPMKRSIHIEGARQHNLKNLTLDIPRDELVVVCGPSGSGKSTLAFDIVYAEGQRRYVESLSAYATAVPAPAGQAGSGQDRGPLPGHLPGAADGHPQPALDRGHGDRGLRLLARLLRPAGQAALPEVRTGPSAPRPATRSSHRSWPCPRAPASTSWRRWWNTRRARTRSG